MTPTAQPLSPETSTSLLARFPRLQAVPSRKLTFGGVGDRDVYNISAPFVMDHFSIIAGRVESRNVELSEIVFFSLHSSVWLPFPGAMTFPGLQDPCITFIDGDVILGGVRFPVTLADGSTGWRMEFYRGKSLGSLKLFFTGPDKMKDIRMLQLKEGRVCVFSRPQGEKGGRGKIGFVIFASLAAVESRAVPDAPLFPTQCVEQEWLGANEAHLLTSGRVGVLGHIACFDAQEHRHYYSMAFCVDPQSGIATAPEIISTRSNFPDGPAKRPDLVDVMFSGGLIRNPDGTATLYAGLSDAEAGCVTIPDPFLKFETAAATSETPHTVGVAK